ncbi:CoA transferase [Novosphingobium sp. CF614]|uniref:CoA transferase n=1 Tax=Novosphingobium sp. CF614 TaxID=1884364 RepID=UPI0015A61182|nr:CoA transferase [Novosphingobium sp. CF614]
MAVQGIATTIVVPHGSQVPGPAMMALDSSVWAGMMRLSSSNDGHCPPPSAPFCCKGGEIPIQAGKYPDFVKPCRISGGKELIADERFAGHARRVEHHAGIMAIVGAIRERQARIWPALPIRHRTWAGTALEPRANCSQPRMSSAIPG